MTKTTIRTYVHKPIRMLSAHDQAVILGHELRDAFLKSRTAKGFYRFLLLRFPHQPSMEVTAAHALLLIRINAIQKSGVRVRRVVERLPSGRKIDVNVFYGLERQKRRVVEAFVELARILSLPAVTTAAVKGIE
jgi:hypothetical protein